MTDTVEHVPHPGSRLDATAKAAEHEAPPQVPQASGGEQLFVVQTRSDMPEECIPRTLILSATNPYLPILPRDMRRRRAVIIVPPSTPGEPVMLCETKELAQQAAAFAAGGGTAPAPGLGGYIPAGTTLVIESRDWMFAAITQTSNASPVTVIVERYAHTVPD